MSTTATIIAIGAILLSGVNAYFVWKLYGRMDGVLTNVTSHFSEIDIENKITSMFASTSSKTVDGLSKIVFKQLQEKYAMKASSYNELINEIKLNQEIVPELKETLVNFFQEIIHVSYRAETVSEAEREALKAQIKIILKQL